MATLVDQVKPSRVWTGRRIARRLASKIHDVTYQSRLPSPLANVANGVRDERLTYLPLPKLDKLGGLALYMEAKGIDGMMLETGCALGGSAILLAAAKRPERTLRVYDVFGMIPAPSDRDGADVHKRYNVIKSGRSRGLGGDTYYGYLDDLSERVRTNFERFGFELGQHHIELHKGLVEHTLVVDEPVALAHIDVDWYDPVAVSLERIWPQVSMGGVVVLDDYFDWSGSRQATDDFFRRREDVGLIDEIGGSLAVFKR